MKKNLLLLSFVFVFVTLNAQIVFYEGFAYNVGDTLPQPDWTGVNTGDQIFITSGSLNYSGFAASTGEKVSFDGIGRDYQRTFTGVTSGTIYMSFLMQVTDMTSLDSVNGGYFTGLGASSTSFGSTVWTRKNGSGYNIGFNPRTTIANVLWDNTVLQLNSVVLVVVSYELVAGTTNDITNIWINPNPTSFGSTSVPTPSLTATNGGTDLSTVDRMFIRQDSQTETPAIDMDEIRVGTTWASVTPGTAGINQNHTENSISFYPNPTTDFITISAKEILNQVQVFDLQGRIVVEYDFNNTSEIKLNVTKLPKGIYNIVAISDKGNTFSSKLIK